MVWALCACTEKTKETHGKTQPKAESPLADPSIFSLQCSVNFPNKNTQLWTIWVLRSWKIISMVDIKLYTYFLMCTGTQRRCKREEKERGHYYHSVSHSNGNLSIQRVSPAWASFGEHSPVRRASQLAPNNKYICMQIFFINDAVVFSLTHLPSVLTAVVNPL